MAHLVTVSEHILDALRRTPDCGLDDLVLSCKSFPLKKVLSEVSRLSREGQLQLTLVSTGSFTVQLMSANLRARTVQGPVIEGINHGNGDSKSQKPSNHQQSSTLR